VNASSGSRVCRRASRRTVSPETENATERAAESRSPMSRAAKDSTPRWVRGTWLSGGTEVGPASTASTICPIVAPT
jgi:hypothetical protein